MTEKHLRQTKIEDILMDRPEFKRPKAKRKIKLLEQIVNDYIKYNKTLEVSLNELKNKAPGKREKRDPTPGQKKVQDSFGQRAKVASELYQKNHSEGGSLTWAEAMTLAGPILSIDEKEVQAIKLEQE